MRFASAPEAAKQTAAPAASMISRLYMQNTQMPFPRGSSKTGLEPVRVLVGLRPAA
jgi:hypothetical protein